MHGVCEDDGAWPVIEIYTTDRDDPAVFDGTIAELFRTVQVHGGAAVFVQPRSGALINLAHVVRIVTDEEPTEPELAPPPGYRTSRPGTASPLPGVRSCPHGFVEGTCSRCAADSVERYDAQPDQP